MSPARIYNQHVRVFPPSLDHKVRNLVHSTITSPKGVERVRYSKRDSKWGGYEALLFPRSLPNPFLCHPWFITSAMAMVLMMLVGWRGASVKALA
jgi:hypothetical protein